MKAEKDIILAIDTRTEGLVKAWNKFWREQ